MTNFYTRALILNFGTCNFRFGWAGDDSPSFIAPSVYADTTDYIFSTEVIEGLEELFIQDQKGEHQYLFGNNALKYQNVLKIHEFKKENNYNILAQFFLFHYKQLNIPTEFQFKQPIIVLIPYYVSEQEKARLKNVFFDTFNFPYLLFLPEEQAIFATLEKRNGVIVNLGESYTYIASAVHGFTNELARDIFPIAGKELTDFFFNLILKSSNQTSNLDMRLAREIKEKCALCVQNVEKELKQVKEGASKFKQLVNLPDESLLELNSERFLVAEPFFDPNLVHVNYAGLDEVIANIIKVWERENWEELISNIILSGGGSMIPGLKDRLKNLIMQYFPDKISQNARIYAVSERENMSWIGASILYSKDLLQKGWLINPSFEAEFARENT